VRISVSNYPCYGQFNHGKFKPHALLFAIYSFQLQSEPVTNRELLATASLTNPLPVPLKKGQFLIEGPGVIKQLKIDVPQ